MPIDIRRRFSMLKIRNNDKDSKNNVKSLVTSHKAAILEKSLWYAYLLLSRICKSLWYAYFPHTDSIHPSIASSRRQHSPVDGIHQSTEFTSRQYSPVDIIHQSQLHWPIDSIHMSTAVTTLQGLPVARVHRSTIFTSLHRSAVDRLHRSTEFIFRQR